jgi:hypothetical protein
MCGSGLRIFYKILFPADFTAVWSILKIVRFPGNPLILLQVNRKKPDRVQDWQNKRGCRFLDTLLN